MVNEVNAPALATMVESIIPFIEAVLILAPVIVTTLVTFKAVGLEFTLPVMLNVSRVPAYPVVSKLVVFPCPFMLSVFAFGALKLV